MKKIVSMFLCVAVVALVALDSFAETRILFSGRTNDTEDYDVYSMKTDGTGLQKHSNTAALDEWGVSLSPDGSQYAFVNSNAIYVAPVATGVATAVGVSGTAVRWANDQELVYIETGGPIKIIQSDGSGSARLASNDTIVPMYMLQQESFFVDQKNSTIYVPNLEMNTFKVRLFSGTFDPASPLTILPIQIPLDMRSDHYTPALSPDGSWIAYSADFGGGEHHLYLGQTGSSNPAVELSGSYSASPAWAPDGSWIAFTQAGQSTFGSSSYVGDIVTISTNMGAIAQPLTTGLSVAGHCAFPNVYDVPAAPTNTLTATATNTLTVVEEGLIRGGNAVDTPQIFYSGGIELKNTTAEYQKIGLLRFDTASVTGAVATATLSAQVSNPTNRNGYVVHFYVLSDAQDNGWKWTGNAGGDLTWNAVITNGLFSPDAHFYASPSNTLEEIGSIALTSTGTDLSADLSSTKLAEYINTDADGVLNIVAVLESPKGDGVNVRKGTSISVGLDTTVTSNNVSLAYQAGANGAISGVASQVIRKGADGATVTASPATGYQFVRWSDGSTDNPRTDMNVMSNVLVTATFSTGAYTLTYQAGANGTIPSNSIQSVVFGADGAEVTAVPDADYRFVNWSDGLIDNPRVDTHISQDLTVTANFAYAKHTLIYSAGANGGVGGSATQQVQYAASGSPVFAVADSGYRFYAWSDGSVDNPRTDANVVGDLAVTAEFVNITAVSQSFTEAATGTISGGAKADIPQTVLSGGFQVKNNSDESTQRIGLMRFDLSSLSVTGTIERATLSITSENPTNATGCVLHFMGLSDAEDKGWAWTGSNGGDLTWNTVISNGLFQPSANFYDTANGVLTELGSMSLTASGTDQSVNIMNSSSLVSMLNSDTNSVFNVVVAVEGSEYELFTVRPGAQLTLLVNTNTVTQNAYDQWASQQGLSGLDADKAADPDKDGIHNLKEYALGLNPGTNDTVGLPTATLVGGTNVVYSFSSGKPDITYQVEVSTNLLDVSGGWMPFGNAVPGTNGATTVRNIPLPIGPSGTYFIQLDVTN